MNSVIATDLPHRQTRFLNSRKMEACSAQCLIEAFHKVRHTTEAFAARFSPEDQNMQSMADASPLKWHRAHTTWFFETFLLKPHLPNYQSPDPIYAFLFNSYYNGVGKQFSRAQRSLISRPDNQGVGTYRKHVDLAIEQLLTRADESALESLAGLITLGLNHEQQHQELMITDIKHALSFNPAAPAWAPENSVQSRSSPIRWTGFEEGLEQFGHEGDCFSFDNETPRHSHYLQAFELASRPSNCGEFIEFIEDGGYTRPELWLADGWAWCRESQRQAPLYWRQQDAKWFHYSAAGLSEIQALAPVCHINFYEAFAFAQWSQARLPSEQEWELAARSQAVAGHFADRGLYQPQAPSGTDAFQQLYGDVWEWTASSYAPYPGFRPARGAVGEYNGKFMANQMVLRGGSCATSPGHIRPSYRNFFYPADRWQFTGVRLARDAE